jgi:tight adherence protein C
MLSRTISESAESGTPAITVAARLLADARSNSRRHVEFQLRQLPTKLTLPIVFCVLPAFLLVALMPFALAGLTSLPPTTLT